MPLGYLSHLYRGKFYPSFLFFLGCNIDVFMLRSAVVQICSACIASQFASDMYLCSSIAL